MMQDVKNIGISELRLTRCGISIQPDRSDEDKFVIVKTVYSEDIKLVEAIFEIYLNIDQDDTSKYCMFTGNITLYVLPNNDGIQNLDTDYITSELKYGSRLNKYLETCASMMFLNSF